MYIEPQGIIKFLANVPLDPNYINTLNFENITDQVEYFSSKAVKMMNNSTYQRVESGVIRVNARADTLYNVNYVMFQNTGFGTKWFYGFVTKVEYKNEQACYVYYQLDVVQSWWCDIEFGDCYIERRHQPNGLFHSLTEEPVNVGDYVVQDYKTNIVSKQTGTASLGKVKFVYILVVSEVKTGSTYSMVSAQAIGNVPNAMAFIPFSDTVTLNTAIQQYTSDGKIESIQDMYCVPEYCLNGISWTNGDYITGSYPNPSEVVVNVDMFPTDIEGYEPKNNKLFSYPYVVFEVTNKAGASQLYKFEDLAVDTDGKFSLVIKPTYLPNGEILLYPSIYKKVLVNIDSGITTGNFQKGIISYSAFADWWAYQQINYKYDSITTLGGGTQKIITGGTKIILDTLRNSEKYDLVPAKTIGNLSTFNLLTASGDLDFDIRVRTIRKEYAIIIDDFFTMYGYSFNRVAKPVFDIRPVYNYIKTSGCNILGNIPADDKAFISKVFDAGVCVWNNAQYVGDYSVNNG